jgi:hypothetical protein
MTMKIHNVLVSFINPTENIIQVKIPGLKGFVHEEFQEASIHTM